jgi:hypothetical protein
MSLFGMTHRCLDELLVILGVQMLAVGGYAIDSAHRVSLLSRNLGGCPRRVVKRTLSLTAILVAAAVSAVELPAT